MLPESIYDDDRVVAGAASADFSRGDPMDVFTGMQVYAEFDSDGGGRQPVVRTVPGRPGRWVLTYSSLERLHAACGDVEVEYSSLSGARLLETKPEDAGIWFDRSFPGGRPILLPPPDLSFPDLPAQAS